MPLMIEAALARQRPDTIRAMAWNLAARRGTGALINFCLALPVNRFNLLCLLQLTPNIRCRRSHTWSGWIGFEG